MILPVWLTPVQYGQVVGLLHLNFESGLPLGILVLTEISLIDFVFVNVTMMSIFINGLVLWSYPLLVSIWICLL